MRLLKVPTFMLAVLVIFYINRQNLLVGSIPIFDLSGQIGPAAASFFIAAVSFILLFLRIPLSVCIFIAILFVDWRVALVGISFAILPVIFLNARLRENELIKKWCGGKQLSKNSLDRFQSQSGLGLSFEVMLGQKDSFLKSVQMLVQERSIIFRELLLGAFFGNLIHIAIEAYAFQIFLNFAVIRSLGGTSNNQELVFASVLLFIQMRLPSIFKNIQKKNT